MLPRVEHRFCAMHCYANWRNEHTGGDLQHAFWACCKSTTKLEYENRIQNIGAIKREAREVRQYVMGRIVNNMAKCAKWGNLFCPKICGKLERNKELSAFCHVRWNGSEGFEMVSGDDLYVVDLVKWKCTCRAWDLTGIPCPHSIAAILWKQEHIGNYGTLTPISNGPTLITGNSVLTSDTSNQGKGIFVVYSNVSKAHSSLTLTIGGPLIPPSTSMPNFGRLERREKQILQGIDLYINDRTDMQILNFGFQGETLISLPKRKKGSKGKEVNIDATIGTKERRNTNAKVQK
ncbi:hypothetical protein GOBAR_DD05630 [Gossypium barbadense]|nr:hypothetical protein GOBAR_DD05630 [Gossypium barbadense]